MQKQSVIRMWITNKNSRETTEEMNAAMVDFLSIAMEHGCIGSTFAEMTLEAFRSSEDYKMKEVKIIQAFVNAGFEIPNDILFNSTAGILFTN